jgi:hypothetical protein
MCTRTLRDFVVVELGAGYGRWSLNTIFLAKRLGIKARAICVEAGKRPRAWQLPPPLSSSLLPSFFEGGCNVSLILFSLVRDEEARLAQTV